VINHPIEIIHVVVIKVIKEQNIGKIILKIIGI
jgi:hypothetical protein